MKPPLAPKKVQRALIRGLKSGLIDIVATDHAPHTDEEKEGRIEESQFGVIGLEFTFPLLYTNLVLKKLLSLRRLIEALSKDVARIFKIRGGEIKEGEYANLVLIDLKLKEKILREDIVSKGKNTPYIGREVYGIPVLTIAQGKVVYERRK